MSTKKSDSRSHRVEEPEQEEFGAPGLWEESDARIDDWEVSRDAAPCAVYRDGPEAMGRVTTPLGDLSFTNLYGGMEAMFRRLGRRSAREIRDGALPFLNDFIGDVVQALVPKLLSGAGRWALDQWGLGRLRDAADDEYLAMLRAFADGSGHDVENVVAGQFLWDVWSLLARVPIDRVKDAARRARRHSPLLGSFSALLPTDSVGPLHLRWFDNAAVDRWDRHNSAVFFHPDRGLSYVVLSSMGFVTGLPCGMNAAGLTLSVESSAGGGVDWDGAPLGMAVHDILSRAHTIEEAVSILREHRSLTPWRYVLCEGDTGRAAVFDAFETVDEQLRSEGTSFFVGAGDGRLPGRQLARVNRWHNGRQRRLRSLVADWSPAGDDAVYDALRELGAHSGGDALSNQQHFGALTNVSAAVLEPANRRLWIGVGRTPVSHRWFVPMSLDPGDQTSAGGLDGQVRPIKPAGDWEQTRQGRAIDHLRHARQLDLEGEQPQRILITLEHAVALDSKQPALHLLVGLMALRARRARRAEGAFRKGLDLIEEPSRRAEVHIYLAWALDAQGSRKEARKYYRRSLQDPTVESAAQQWARRGQRHKFRSDDIEGCDIDYSLATVFER